MTFTPWFLDDENSWMMPTEVEEDGMGISCAIIGAVCVVGLLYILWKITEGVRR